MGKRKPVQGRTRTSQRWDNVPETNEAFESYYKAQNIIPGADGGDGEWREFMKALKTDLPTTFRITGSKKTADVVNDVVADTYVPFLAGLQHQGEQVEPPQKISWYPGGLAWQLKVNKQVIRKSSEFKRFQNFLVYESEAGNVSRQEAVSMIPPLLLDVRPDHYVLDMCAAPGSKTAQLLEALHAPNDGPEESTSIPRGLLIANDSDYKRTHLLVHQSLRRIPGPSMMVTNLDAASFPNLKLPSNLAKADRAASEEEPSKRMSRLMFDRILADVPCTGDGTMRKNVGIWRDWSIGNAQGLHSVQLRILKRAFELLRPGGRMVYSTCSLNPIENEAVVSAALAASLDMSLVDVSDRLPDLIRRPGLLHWKVMKRDGSGELSIPLMVASADAKRYPASLWPDGKEGDRHIERCLRIYPHLQDTGGFFVAVLEKQEAPSKAAESINAEADASEDIMDAVMAVERADGVQPDGTREESAVSMNGAPSKRPRSPEGSSPIAKKLKGDDEPASSAVGDALAAASVGHDADANAIQPGAALDNPQAVPDDLKPATNPSEREKAFKEEPYTFLSPNDEQVKICIEFFDLKDNFPSSNLLVRNAAGQPVRSIYLTSTVVRHIVLCNAYTRMRLVSCGVKLFARQDHKSHGEDAYRCKWRVVSDGTSFFRPFVGPSRVVPCNVETLRQLMDGQELYPKFETLFEPAFRDAVQNIAPGSTIVDVQPGEFEGAVVKHPIPIGLWVSKASVNIMLEKRDKSALALRVFGVDISASKGKRGIVKIVGNDPAAAVGQLDGDTAADAEPAEDKEGADAEGDQGEAGEDGLLEATV